MSLRVQEICRCKPAPALHTRFQLSSVQRRPVQRRISSAHSPVPGRVSSARSRRACTCRAGFFQVSGLCFDAACQQQADTAFLVALSIPLIVAGVAIAYILRAPPKEALESGSIFRDPKTGAFFEAPEGESPLKDQKGELAFRAISYTPWPVPEDYEGVRLRIAVGERSNREMRTFVFNPLKSNTDVLAVTLPRPLGVVFEYDERRRQAHVVDLVEGSYAEQRKKVAGLNQRLGDCVLPGDVLRAVTCTNFVYPTNALFGTKPPERHIVLYGADKQKWSAIRGALRKGDVKDGDVTLVVERQRG